MSEGGFKGGGLVVNGSGGVGVAVGDVTGGDSSGGDAIGGDAGGGGGEEAGDEGVRRRQVADASGGTAFLRRMVRGLRRRCAGSWWRR